MDCLSGPRCHPSALQRKPGRRPPPGNLKPVIKQNRSHTAFCYYSEPVILNKVRTPGLICQNGNSLHPFPACSWEPWQTHPCALGVPAFSAHESRVLRNTSQVSPGLPQFPIGSYAFCYLTPHGQLGVLLLSHQPQQITLIKGQKLGLDPERPSGITVPVSRWPLFCL